MVERFLAANDALDVDGMFKEIGEDLVWSFAAAPAGPEGNGWQAEQPQLLRVAASDVEEVQAPSPRSARTGRRPGARGRLLRLGRVARRRSEYKNTYLSLVRVRDGKIVHWIEFSDPGPLERGLATMLRSRGS